MPCILDRCAMVVDWGLYSDRAHKQNEQLVTAALNIEDEVPLDEASDEDGTAAVMPQQAGTRTQEAAIGEMPLHTPQEASEGSSGAANPISSSEFAPDDPRQQQQEQEKDQTDESTSSDDTSDDASGSEAQVAAPIKNSADPVDLIGDSLLQSPYKHWQHVDPVVESAEQSATGDPALSFLQASAEGTQQPTPKPPAVEEQETPYQEYHTTGEYQDKLNQMIQKHLRLSSGFMPVLRNQHYLNAHLPQSYKQGGETNTAPHAHHIPFTSIIATATSMHNPLDWQSFRNGPL